MLTSTGYITGLLVYVLSALLALWPLNRWLLRWAGPGLRLLISLPVAALLLTPAYIQAGAETLAPALVVAAFQWLSQGPEAAEHALRPLMLFTAVAAGIAALGALLLAWRDRRSKRPDPALDISGAP